MSAASPGLFLTEAQSGVGVEGGGSEDVGTQRFRFGAEPLMGMRSLRPRPDIWGCLWSAPHHPEGLHSLGAALDPVSRSVRDSGIFHPT